MATDQGDFPSLNGRTTQPATQEPTETKEETPAVSLNEAAKSGLKVSGKEFVPKGKIIQTAEQFPDLADVGASKKKKGGFGKQTVKKDTVESDDPAKGKPS